jgi:putative ABC transport system permease protein
VRYGFRLLGRNPGFSSIAILTLALGIGANTAIFSVVNAALLRALPYRDPERLVYVWSAEKARGINQSTVSIPDLRDWREQSRVFDGLAGWWSGSYNLSGGDEPRQVAGWTVAPIQSRCVLAKSASAWRWAPRLPRFCGWWPGTECAWHLPGRRSDW